MAGAGQSQLEGVTKEETTMTVGLLFWFLMIIALIFGWVVYPPTPPNYRPFGYSLLLWILLVLLGIGVFGWPIKG